MGHYFETRASKIINFGWEHGRYADFWSGVHLLSGFIFGSVGLLLSISPLFAFIVIVTASIMYEMLEVVAGVVEDAENSIIDIILAGVGASFSLYLFPALQLSPRSEGLFLIMAIIGNLFLLHQGWNAYLKRESYKKRSHRYVLMALQALTLLGILAIPFIAIGLVW